MAQEEGIRHAGSRAGTDAIRIHRVGCGYGRQDRRGSEGQGKALWFRNLTLDEEASTQDHMVLRAEDGTYITIDQDERNPKLVYHEDSKSLGLAIGGQEIDITEELLEDGVYTTEYTYEGKTYGVTIQGELETAQMKVEPQ